jgi:hypothetical protein
VKLEFVGVVCCVFVHRIRSFRDLYSSIAWRGVPYLDMNWQDMRIDGLALRYCTGFTGLQIWWLPTLI